MIKGGEDDFFFKVFFFPKGIILVWDLTCLNATYNNFLQKKISEGVGSSK